MNSAALAFCLCLSFGAQPAQDRWIAEDKFKHFFTSFVVTSISASAARTAGLDVETSALVGTGVGASIGIWKEIDDIGKAKETASLRDLTWDFAGVGAAFAMMRQVR
jgi:uncharacterized protein YfiM (DUF2279 family)